MTASAAPKTPRHPFSAPAGILFALCSLLCVFGAGPAAASAQTFGFTGDEQAFTVPAGVHSLQVIAIGAEGGKGSDSAGGAIGGGVGGLGARVEAELAVAPGQTLFLEVGGPGASGQEFSRLGEGGFNGGGTANNGSPGAGQFTSFPGGGGGGATDVRTCSRHAASCPAGGGSLESRLLVAGGAGGGGALGGGGGYAGEDGLPASAGVCGAGVPGEGGSKGAQTAGGDGGGGAASGVAGTLGIGGSTAIDTLNFKAGGGGGGGYFGGGAGGSGCPGGGGGGGSSFVAAGARNVSVKNAPNGVAEVVITPAPALPEPKGGPKRPSDFSFGRLTRNRRKGTGRLAVILPGPGTLALKGKGLVTQRRSIGAAGTVNLPIRARGPARRGLIAKGRAKLKASVSFQPSGEALLSKTRPIKLIKKPRRSPH